MICSFCQKIFKKKQGIEACGACPIKNCNMIKCPYCGFENIFEGKITRVVRRLCK